MEKPGNKAADLFGVYYPQDHIVAVVADAEQAAAIQRDLQADGWAADSVKHYSGQSVSAAYEQKEAERGLLQKIGRALSSDERLFSDQYREAAQAGHSFVVIHITEPATVEAAQAILARHSANSVRFYDQWTVRSLPTTGPDAEHDGR